MSLPGDLSTVIATGSFVDAEGTPMRGQVTFTPTATLTDASGEVIIPQFPRTYPLFDGTFLTDPMVATDNDDISPQGWAYDVSIELQAVPAWTVTLLLPHSGAPIDISTLLPTSGTPYLPGYLPVTGGALTGTLTLDGSPPLRVGTGAAAGDVMTSDSSGNATWEPLSIPAATSGAVGGVELNTDLGGTATAPQVVSTHLALALPVGQGGTGAATQNFVDLSTEQDTIGGIKTFTGAVNVPAPSASTSAVTKAYADAISTGLQVKPAAVAATTGSETFTVSAGSVSQIGGTVVDGVSPNVNDLVLVKDAPASTGTGSVRSSVPGNGLYIVTSNTTNLSVSRATAMSSSNSPVGAFVFTTGGTTNAGAGYVVTTPASGAFTYGSGSIQWTQFSSAV